MLFHYWKMGNYILYHQNLHGWGGKIIKKLAQAIRFNYPEKKGYSERNLTYMCQFARTFSVEVLQKMLSCDVKLKKPTIDNVQSATRILDNLQFVQEVPAQIKEIGRTISFMLQTSIGEIEHPALHY